MTQEMSTAKLHAIGMSNEQTECDECGRMELRGTVILGNDEGEVGRYGTTCAGKLLGYKITRRDAVSREAIRRCEVTGELRRAHKAKADGDLAAMRMYLDGARKVGIVRDDERAMIEKLAG